jgi:hypothetical protein
VESIITDKRDILSVQTLRNWIMASSFLASTAMIIGLGLLSFLFKPDHISEIPFDPTFIFTRMKTLFMVKLMFLMVHFFFAFFSFTLSIRYMKQINFMINGSHRLRSLAVAGVNSQHSGYGDGALHHGHAGLLSVGGGHTLALRAGVDVCGQPGPGLRSV